MACAPSCSWISSGRAAPVRWLNRLVLMAAPFTDEIRRGKVNHDAWERGYYGKKQGRG